MIIITYFIVAIIYHIDQDNQNSLVTIEFQLNSSIGQKIATWLNFCVGRWKNKNIFVPECKEKAQNKLITHSKR